MPILNDVPIVINRESISGTVYFDTLDDDRLVSATISAAIFLMIKERIKENEDVFFNFDLLLPENIGVISPSLKYSQFVVDKNYRLLKPDNILSFEEALFLLLGLNTEAIKSKSGKKFQLLGSELSSNTIEKVFLSTPIYEVLSRSRFVKGGEILSNDLVAISKQFKFINQSRLNCIINPKHSKIQVEKDIETGIPRHRLTIYHETLPLYLAGLDDDERTSLRGLTLDSREISEGKYTIKYKDKLGVGGATIRKDLSALFKSSWWINQPDSIKEKIPTLYKK